MFNFFSLKKAPASDDKVSIEFGKESEENIEITSPPTDQEEVELPVDLIRERGALVIRAPLVGAKEEDLSLTVKGNLITINKNATPLPEGEESILQECYWGPLSRTITIDDPIEPEKITAELKKGILTVRIPLLKEKTKVIEITDDEKSN